jgi:mono/diheme cytochrome c family protein
MTVKHVAAAGIAALAMLVSLPADPATKHEAPGGEALFYTNCATCHVGSSALMGMRPPPDLFRDPLNVGDSAEALTAVIRSGAGGGRMPSFAAGLDESETRALVAFIRSQRQR